jgi:diguanylate cyclase (GGDEF)-like protein
VNTIAEKEALAERLRHQAFHDALTGLPNRALFHDRLQHALDRGQRQGEGVALLFIDLDGFKAINDVLGHEAGDRVLQEVAHRLQGAVRTSDTVARLGGDEFGVLLEETTGPAEAEEAMARIRDALDAPLQAAGRAVTMTASLGAAFAGPHDDADALLRVADTAMYEAKREVKEHAAAASVPSRD